jgi:hypothetical protein
MSDPGDGFHPEVPFEIRVRSEIWESFVSLLRSYAAAAGPNFTVERLSDFAQVKHEGRILSFCFDPSTGKAVWREARPDMELSGNFQINQDGTLQVGGKAEPVDMAVIDWIAQLRQNNGVDFSLLDQLASDLKIKP